MNQHETNLTGAFKNIIKTEDWDKFSNCENGYINVRKVNLMNGFICDFKEKCKHDFIQNFLLVEKDFNEEMKQFDYSRLHYHNLERLLLQSKAIKDTQMDKYAYIKLNTLKEIENKKINAISQYFIENFESLKQKRNDELGKTSNDADKEEKPETFWEWSNDNGLIKLGFWANNLAQNTFRTVSTKFKEIPIFIREFHKNFVVNNSIVRFVWCNSDIREYCFTSNRAKNTTDEFEDDEDNQTIQIQFTPYYSISGTYIIDELTYPAKALTQGNWEIREMIGERYKHGEGEDGSFTKNVKMRYRILLSDKIFLNDTKDVKLGLYDPNTMTWNIEEAQDVALKEEEKERDKVVYKETIVEFTTTELGIFSVLLERKINFPFKAWNLRCIKKDERLVALLDLESKFIIYYVI